jgi:hypothetical protein
MTEAEQAQQILARIKSAEGMAPPGSYEHSLYVSTAIHHDWPMIRYFLERAASQSPAP